MSTGFPKISRRRRVWVGLVVFTTFVFVAGDAMARGRAGGAGGRAGGGGFSRGGSGRSPSANWQSSGRTTNRQGSRTATQPGRQSDRGMQGERGRQADRGGQGERTERSGDRQETRGDRNSERTEGSDKRQEERTERVGERQDGLTDRQDNRQDFYEDNHWGYGWGHQHHYYGAGAIWAGLVIGAAIATVPHHHEVIVVTGTTYYYSSGVYYLPASSGTGYTVVAAPAGAAVQELPEQTINVNVSTGDTVQYANGAYYEEKPPEVEGAEPSYQVIEPPQGATVPYVPEGAVEKKVGSETYYVSGDTYYKAFYSGSDVVYMVTKNPEA